MTLVDKRISSNAPIEDFLVELQSARSLASLVAMPKGLKVEVGGITAFDPFQNTLSFDPMFAKPMNDTWIAVDRKNARAVMIHEYGHAVHHAAMTDPRVAWTRFSKERNEIASLIEEIEKPIRENTPRVSGGEGIDWTEVRKTNPKLDAAYKRHEENAQMLKVVQAYGEFFSDFLAVVHSGDSRIIFDALPSGGEDARRLRLVRARDFSTRYKGGELKDWVSDVTRRDDSLPYLLLAPSRYALWKRITRLEKSVHEKKKLVKAVFDALQIDFEKNFPDYASLERLNPQAINESLSKTFSKLLLE